MKGYLTFFGINDAVNVNLVENIKIEHSHLTGTQVLYNKDGCKEIYRIRIATDKIIQLDVLEV